jgi:hypothetical protein
MVIREKLDLDYLSYRRIPEPGKILEREENFLLVKEQPEAML